MKIALSLFAMLLAGIGIGYVAGSGGKDSLPTQGYPGTEHDTGSAATHPVEERSAFTAGSSEANTLGDSSASSTPVSALAVALAELPQLPVAEGFGTIRGTVLSGDGSPVAGVTVEASPRKSMYPKQQEAGDDLERVKQYAQRLSLAERLSGKAETADDGSYTLIDLQGDGAYRVTATKDGWTIHSVHDAGKVQPDAVVDFKAARVTAVPIDVVFADGSEVTSARVIAKMSGGRGGSAYSSINWTPTNREIKLQAGSYTVSAKDTDDLDTVSEHYDIVVTSGQAAEPVRIVLKTQPGIKGRVEFPEGEVAENAIVRWARSRDGSPVEAAKLRDSRGDDHVSSYNKYAFKAENLTPGTYTIGVQRDWGGPVVGLQTIVVGDALVSDVVLSMPPLNRNEYIVFNVRGPNGESIEDLSAEASYFHGTGRNTTSAHLLRQPDSVFWAIISPPDDIALDQVDRVVFQLEARRFGVQSLEWVPGDAMQYTVIFQPPASAMVSIAGFVGSGYEDDLTLSVTKSTEQERHRHRFGGSGIDAQGQQKFGPFEPGEYKVQLYYRVSRHYSRLLNTAVANLNSGDNEVSIALPPLYSLTVHTELKKGEGLRLQPIGQPQHFDPGVKVDENGVAIFHALAAGEYLLTERNTGLPQQMQVSIPAQLDVNYEPVQPNAVQVTITDPNGKLAKAGLQEGDLLTGANGEDFMDMLQMMRIVQEAISTGSMIKFAVLRGTQALEVEVDAKNTIMGGPAVMGGDLQPVTR